MSYPSFYLTQKYKRVLKWTKNIFFQESNNFPTYLVVEPVAEDRRRSSLFARLSYVPLAYSPTDATVACPVPSLVLLRSSIISGGRGISILGSRKIKRIIENTDSLQKKHCYNPFTMIWVMGSRLAQKGNNVFATWPYQPRTAWQHLHLQNSIKMIKYWNHLTIERRTSRSFFQIVEMKVSSVSCDTTTNKFGRSLRSRSSIWIYLSLLSNTFTRRHRNRHQPNNTRIKQINSAD